MENKASGNPSPSSLEYVILPISQGEKDMCHSFVPSFIHKALNEHLLLGIMLGAGEIEMDTSCFLTTGNSSSEKKKRH